MHGKVDQIHHDNRGLFAGLPNPFTATRYHSLVIEPGTLSDDFEVSAWSIMPDGSREIMGVRHKRYPLFGLQFHPESFLTRTGRRCCVIFSQCAGQPKMARSPRRPPTRFLTANISRTRTICR